MFRDQIIAAIRTGSAVIGAAIVTWLISNIPGVEIDPAYGTALGVALAAVGVAVYNFVVNWAATNVWAGFGWLLGVNKAPSYVNDKTIPGELVEADDDEPEIDLAPGDLGDSDNPLQDLEATE